MYRILLISEDGRYRVECLSALRKAHYQVTAESDIIDALKLLKQYKPQLVVWYIEPDNALAMKALSALRGQYKKVKLLLIVDENRLTKELRQMSESVIIRAKRINKLVRKAIELTGEPPAVLSTKTLAPHHP